jgi:hypothetical protein
MRAAYVLIILIPLNSYALLNGGAQDLAEYQKIVKLAPSMESKCDLKPYLNPSADQVQNITANLLNNETSCNPKFIMQWDSKAGEDFPSIGLPHVVWFREGQKQVVDESFPRFWKYIKDNYKGTAQIPNLGDPSSPSFTSPWKTKEEFDASPLKGDIGRFLLDPDVIKLQAQFAMKRGVQSAYLIMAANSLDPNPKISNENICGTFKKLLSSKKGLREIIDYANWKGEGVHYEEATKNQKIRWGLKQVIENMGSVSSPDDAEKKFADASEQALKTRVTDDPGLQKSMPGLMNRIASNYRGDGISAGECKLMPKISGSASAQAAAGK